MQSRRMRQCVIFASVLVVALGLSTSMFAADESIKAVVTGRNNDGTLTVRTDDSSIVIVVLSDLTKVRRTDGLRKLKVSQAELIPGLRVRVEGAYETGNRFIATRVEYSRDNMKTALDIQGGVNPTDQLARENRELLAQQARTLEQQRQTINQQSQAIAMNSAGIRSNAERAVATSGAVAAANARIANLDEFNVLSSMTVHFANGRASIAPKYRAQLQQLAAQARNTPGYVIQVEGFASAVGPETVNQRLSRQRADGVAAVLTQSGIPPTNLLPPAAMGVSQQVATNSTAQGQAQNRRTVVKILQNKGLAQ